MVGASCLCGVVITLVRACFHGFTSLLERRFARPSYRSHIEDIPLPELGINVPGTVTGGGVGRHHRPSDGDALRLVDMSAQPISWTALGYQRVHVCADHLVPVGNAFSGPSIRK